MTPAALLAALVLQATPETLAELERAYDQTCNDRIYGQFDDMCSAMAERVKRYRAELKRHRAAPAPTKGPPPPAPPALPPPAPAPAPPGEG